MMNVPPRPPQTARGQKTFLGISQRWLPWVLGGGAVLIGMLLVFALVLVVGIAALARGERVAQGVTVAGLPVGGSSPEEAVAMLQDVLPGQTISARDGDRAWVVSLAQLGVSLNVPATLRALEDVPRGAVVIPVYAVDLNQTQTGLFELSTQVNLAAVPGNPPQYGRAMDIPVTLDRLRVDTTGELSDGLLELDMIEVAPPALPSGASDTGARTTHIVEQGQELGLIAREYNVTMDDIVALNGITNPDLLYVGQELIIPAAGVYTPTPDEAPPAPSSTGRAIVVSTQSQRIYAYENGQLVRSHLVSTGLPETPTVLGDYSIYVKYVADDMSGPDYFLPSVPYTMYFYQGYGIHGTYWHNNFGRPMSHGCVNLPTSEAEWFFNFAEVGILVRVI